MSLPTIRQEPQQWPDRRATERFPAALPVILDVGGTRISARLIDLGVGGGRVEATVIPMIRSSFRLHCGTIDARATVLWCRGSQIGFQFQFALSGEQVFEQVRRTQALAARRNLRIGPA